MIGLVWRTIVIYLFVILTLRLMGKRQIGELEASELVVTIIISEIAALPITDTKIPLHHVFLPIGILLVMEHVISYLDIAASISVRHCTENPACSIKKENSTRKKCAVKDLIWEI